jgi:demethylmenaquinone methyltransferase/2-methoxy-6-polyprenyl-1,4-benzoquinol methylase
VFFVDSRKTQQSTATNHAAITEAGTVERKLNDDRTFHIVKLFYDPEELTARLAALGWDARIRSTDTFFLYGTAERASSEAT